MLSDWLTTMLPKWFTTWRGGRDDEPSDLCDDGTALWSPAGVSNVGEVALYARRARFERPARGARPARRGPTPTLSDAQLLAAIRTDLARSPFQGEGHRRVHARLRILDRIRSLPDAGVARDAHAGAALAPPRAAG